MSCIRLILVLLCCIVLGIMPLRAQLFINEVSNGPSGAQEYVELVVVGTPGCTATCVDLRGWILDDNNGYFASGTGTGIAQGHMRFTTSSTWQCVPIGTIIVIYNESDRNPSIPADNLTGANCTYILPASSTLFERNVSTPVVSGSQTYGVPYAAGGAWSTQGLSNTDDSYQLRDPSNLTVPFHAVGYGNNTTNPIIYFAGGGGQSVFSMVNTVDDDPLLQANWFKGTTAANQTPGLPNNTANATWISAMNNNCSAPGVTVDLGADVAVCPGDSITLTATVNIPGGVFVWNGTPLGSVDTFRFAPSSAVNIVVSYNVAVGCTDADTVFVNIFAPPTGAIAGNLSVCAGQSTTLTASGGNAFNWSTTEVTPAITVSPTTNTQYTVTVTNAAGCSDTVSATVNVNSLPVGTITGDTIICTGTSTTLTASGGTTNVWSTTETTAAITVAPTTNTTYTVTITDGNGCADTVSSTVTTLVAAGGNITGNTTICRGDSTNLAASGGATYLWSTTEVNQIITVAPTSNTNYSVTVTDGNGCLDTVAVSVTVNIPPTGAIAGNLGICAGQSTTLTASGGTSYVWSTTEVTPAITVSPTTNTQYTVTVTNALGCTDTVSATVIVNSLPVGAITGNTTVCSGTNTTLTANGGTNYVWSTTDVTAAITVAPTINTTYTVTITDGNGCADTVASTVTTLVAAGGSITGDTTICSGESTNLTANGGTSYVWSTTEVTPTVTVSPTTNTTYRVTVTDGNGCLDTVSQLVTVTPAPVANAGADDVICEGGSVFLTASGGGTYLWSTTETTAAISVSPTTTTDYIVTVTLNGCSDTDTVTITVNPNNIILAVDNITPETCNLSNGQINLLSPSNFVTYTLFQNGQAIDTVLGGGVFFDLTAGTYDIVAADNNGCQRNIANVVVPSVVAPPFTVEVFSPLCFGNNNGSIIFTGASSLTYSINGGAAQTSGSFTGLVANDYTFTIADNASGCDTAISITLTQPDALVASILPDSVNILTGDAVDLVSTTIGGTVPYTYLWVPAAGLDCDTCQTVSASPVDSLNVYILTVADSNGCIDTARAVVRVSNEFIITVPSGFTPNGDGWNDYLRPLSNEPIDFNLRVYNRWGEKIFEGDNLPGWDGTYKYEEQPISTYVYVIEYTRLLTGKKGFLTGSITLLR